MDPIVAVLESAMALQDPYTVGHQRRVARISLALGRELGLEDQRLAHLEMAARLHDFGKISIPLGLLSKRGKLSGHEMAAIKCHPMVAVNLPKPLTLPPSTFMTIMQHHERINASGYPFGLTGQDILLEAKIWGVADVVEAIASHRPYRRSLGVARPCGKSASIKGSFTIPRSSMPLGDYILAICLMRSYVLKPVNLAGFDPPSPGPGRRHRQPGGGFGRLAGKNGGSLNQGS